jgi:hypothetical protein
VITSGKYPENKWYNKKNLEELMLQTLKQNKTTARPVLTYRLEVSTGTLGNRRIEAAEMHSKEE